MRTGRKFFLKEVGLDRIPDILVRIEVARYMGVDPDWFESHSIAWADWGLVALDIHNNLNTPTQKG